MNNQQPSPLEGLKVLDLTSNISGPSATAILGDLGAEIIKVEKPGKGDDARGMGPHINGESAYFLAINRNKQSIVIDIKKKEGQSIIQHLAKQVDIVIENFRRGVLEKYQLDAKSLTNLNPRLIYCSLSAYGEEGPDAHKAGYDAVLQARTGMVSVTGSRPEEPARAGVSVLDMGSGMWSVIAILSALQYRNLSGEGQIVGSSLFETGIYWMNYHFSAYQIMRTDPIPQGTSHTAFAPYGDYQTSDDLILIGISNDSLFNRLVKEIGIEDLTIDSRFLHNENRVEHKDELNDILSNQLVKKPSDYWLSKFEAVGIPCSKIQKVSQVYSDPQLEALNMLQQVPHKAVKDIKIPRLPIRLSKSPTQLRNGAPLYGEQTESVLSKYGFLDEEIESFKTKGIIE